MKRQYVMIAATLIAICFGASLEAQQKSPVPVTVRFAAVINGKPFACGQTYENVGLTKVTVTPQDLHFFVTDVELLRKDGDAVALALDQDGIWQYKNVVLLDFEDGTGYCRNGNSATHQGVSGVAPSGEAEYVGLRFTLGVPFDLDHLDTVSAPSPLNMTAMFWTWQSGYKLMRAEVATLRQRSATAPIANSKSGRSGESNGFPVHLGSTGCRAASNTSAPAQECGHPNRVVVPFPEFKISSDIVVFDLGKLLEDVDLAKNAPNSAPGCMSSPDDPDCAAPFKALGLAWGNVQASPQTVFSREAEQ